MWFLEILHITKLLFLLYKCNNEYEYKAFIKILFTTTHWKSSKLDYVTSVTALVDKWNKSTKTAFISSK